MDRVERIAAGLVVCFWPRGAHVGAIGGLPFGLEFEGLADEIEKGECGARRWS